MNTTIRKIINTHNFLSDKSFIWFPFIFLKPKPATLITQKRILLMTLCFGCYAGLAYIIKAHLSGSLTPQLALKSLAIGNLGFFVWFQTVTSTLWNIRAKELSKDNK